FDRALELNPDYAQGYFMRALTYRQTKHEASALADFRKSCDLGFQRGCVKWKEGSGQLF
ncbi:MAG: tetratricopeptide repeat protein, partial [Burkholderiales bacterium]